MKKYKYKVVVKTGNKIFVRKRGSNKYNLESYALRLSKKYPKWRIYIANENTIV